MLPIERRPPLSVMTMNQLVNIPIKSCRIHAGKGDKEAQSMWHLWNRMVYSPFHLTPRTFYSSLTIMFGLAPTRRS